MKYLGTRNEQYDPVVTQDISGKQDKATLEADVAAKGFTKNTGTYSKPAGGIPKTDLSDSVQASLGKADTALQTLFQMQKRISFFASPVPFLRSRPI